jgi:aminopeptidase N
MSWKRYTPALQALMKHELEALAKLPQLSKDVYEIVSKSIV